MTWFVLESRDMPPAFSAPRNLTAAEDAAQWASTEGAAAVWMFRGGRWAREALAPEVGVATGWYYYWAREEGSLQVSQGWLGNRKLTPAERDDRARSFAYSTDSYGNGFLNFFWAPYSEATGRFGAWVRVK